MFKKLGLSCNKDYISFWRRRYSVFCAFQIYNLDYILKKGAPPKKLLLGLSTYGHVYELKEIPRSNYFGLYYDEKVTSILTNQPGLIGYNEVGDIHNQSSYGSHCI